MVRVSAGDGSEDAAGTMSTQRPSRRTPAKRRILIVDDHPVIRRGLTVLIDDEPDLVVCAEAATQRAAMEAIDSSKPDLVITGFTPGTGTGLALVREIRSLHATVRVLVLTLHDAPAYARRAFEAGASGYVTKQGMTDTLLAAIRCVLGGGKYVSAKLDPGA